MLRTLDTSLISEHTSVHSVLQPGPAGSPARVLPAGAGCLHQRQMPRQSREHGCFMHLASAQLGCRCCCLFCCLHRSKTVSPSCLRRLSTAGSLQRQVPCQSCKHVCPCTLAAIAAVCLATCATLSESIFVVQNYHNQSRKHGCLVHLARAQLGRRSCCLLCCLHRSKTMSQSRLRRLSTAGSLHQRQVPCQSREHGCLVHLSRAQLGCCGCCLLCRTCTRR